MITIGKSRIGKILKENSKVLEKMGIKIYFPKHTDKIGGLSISKVYIDEDFPLKWIGK